MLENQLNLTSSLLEDTGSEDNGSTSNSKGFWTAGGLPSCSKGLPLITSGFVNHVNRSVGSFSMAPPSLSMSPPSLCTFGVEGPIAPHYSHLPSLKIKERLTDIASSKDLWEVTDSSVPTLPEHHPLERTAVFVPHTSASTVASRVIDVLSERSISSKFYKDKAKVKCVTSYNVDFRIRLYRGKGKFSHGIIVELQRRFGYSPYFQTETQAILDAAEGNIAAPQYTPHTSVSDNDTLDSVPLPSLDLFSKLISSSKYDSQVLAINGLAALTDSVKVGLVKAENTIKSLLSKENEALYSHVFNIVRSGHLKVNDQAQGSIDKQFAVQEKAMAIVARVVKHSKTAICDSLKSLTPVLLSSLKNAHEDTRLASYSASIILEMLKNSYDNCLPETNEIFNAMIQARFVGELQNNRLSELSNHCIRLMA
uniref:Uncharacterized protein n=1 Tax=Eucampia antarctica TaxID=49252 RepID=A0A7S2WA98_9STRA|mmetsp:Transcript_24744/g.23767  ORF Transcript_24744/g.23767 Transcript_24744/m.23767 type:complete len:424 (+) Transcript_24744:56-1327(+)